MMNLLYLQSSLSRHDPIKKFGDVGINTKSAITIEYVGSNSSGDPAITGSAHQGTSGITLEKIIT